MARRRTNDVTIREGTGERHWYSVAAYVAIGIVGAVGIPFMALTGNLGAVGATVGFAILFVVLVFGSLVAFVGIFKDSAYVRDTRGHWMPKWWYYIGSPFVLGVGVYLAAGALWTGDAVNGLGMAVFALSTFVSSAYYLYNRHTHIGVP